MPITKTSWVKGHSSNPKGRPKESVEAKAMARVFGKECVEKLVDLMRNSPDDRIQLAAATTLLDRGFGKPLPDEEKTVDITPYVVRLPEKSQTSEQWAALMAPKIQT